jgi:hypothetical protein
MRSFLFLTIMMAVAGCASHVPLTKGLMKDYGLSVNDIPKLQLYVSDGILLEKHAIKIDKNINAADYSLKKVEDYYVKQIYFAKGTPCVAKSAVADKLMVAFEHPGDVLGFTSDAHGNKDKFFYQPDKKYNRDTIKMRPSEAGFSDWKTIGEEVYSDTEYTVLIESEMPFLIVDKSSLKNFILESRRVKGLKQTEIKARY